MTAEPAFYRHEAGGFAPTGLGLSPWTANAQMGVCLAGLLVHALESVPSQVPMVTARLTIDILGAVPLETLVATTRILRDGKRLQLVEAELRIGERVWLRGTALRLRIGESPEGSVALAHPLPDEAEAPSGEHWVHVVRLAGDHRRPGPGASWIRWTSTLIAGEKVTPLQAVAMVADFGSGTAPLLPMETWTFANVDISIHLTRPPRGEWLLVDATSESAGNGIGLTHTRLGDRDGMFGMAHQTTFLSRR
jgi:hypothetical protein